MTAPSLGRVLIVDDEVELRLLARVAHDQATRALGRRRQYEALALLQEEDIDLLCAT
jgi:hypothetical protein